MKFLLGIYIGGILSSTSVSLLGAFYPPRGHLTVGDIWVVVT